MRALQLAFAGTPDFAVPALQALAASRHRIAAVFTQPDRPAGRGRVSAAGAVKRRAIELGITVHQPAALSSPEAQDILAGLRVDALIVVAYGVILPSAVLRWPRLGCFNIHASLLPRWRGAAPIHRAILAGDAQTGITIMRLDEGLDTGPMLVSAKVAIGPHDTTAFLHDKLAPLGARLIVETVDALAAGTVQETPQPAQGVTYAPKIAKSEALIDWAADSESIDRRVRAFNPWPIAYTHWRDAPLRIWAATALAAPSGKAVDAGTVLAFGEAGIDVACGSGILRITRLQLPGRAPVESRDFVHAHSLHGARFGGL